MHYEFCDFSFSTQNKDIFSSCFQMYKSMYIAMQLYALARVEDTKFDTVHSYIRTYTSQLCNDVAMQLRSYIATQLQLAIYELQ